MNIKVVTLFSGYDSQCMALDRLYSNFDDFNYELIAWSEIDKYAIQAHNAIYPQWKDRNLGDVCKIDWAHVSDFDLLTYSSPCQDFSIAGNQKGGNKGSGTRSSLLWECERAIRTKLPKYLLMENVSALVGEKFVKLFNKWQSILENYGYTNYAKILNAKDFGVPQNRERIFMVSVRNDIEHRFYYPNPFRLKSRLKDVLENNVEDKYKVKYDVKNVKINKTNTDKTICVNSKDNGKQPSLSERIYDTNGIGTAVTTSFHPNILYSKVKQICNIVDDSNRNFKNPQAGRVYSVLGLAPARTCCGGGNLEPKILENYIIRKLTPHECFRLMDVSEDNIDKLLGIGISNSQLYKLAGNSIVVNCLYHIFRKLFINTENESTQTELF